MSIRHLQAVARDAVYGPCRDMAPLTQAPEYASRGVKEVPYCEEPGCRTFIALTTDGLRVATGILEPGGDEGAIRHRLMAALLAWESGGFLQAVG